MYFKNINFLFLIMSKIQEFYSYQSVFITGGTGFLGKILIEKLLRSCPKIKDIYILVRPKKGKQIRDRVKELISSRMFEPLNEIDQNFANKIIPLAGDIIEPNFGLSTADLDLLKKEVSIVFHAAATTRFDEPLKTALKVNVDSVKTVIDICKGCKNLKAFIYVSTAFSNCIYEHIEEKVYPVPLSHKKLTELVSAMDQLNMSNEEKIKFTKIVIGKFPNTYCFTKAVAEDLVNKSAKELPVSVFRFSIALAALKEPLKGWVDSKQAITQTLIGIASGIIRVINAKLSANMEIVPIDLTCNCLIASAWDTSSSKKNEQKSVKVYNYVSGRDNPGTWDYMQSYLRTQRYKLALKKTYYHPDVIIIESFYLFFILHYILHFIPAILGDLLLRIIGRKPVLHKVFKKGTKLVRVIRFFTNGEWIFDTDNVKSLWEKLSENDKKLFNFDITSFTWDVMLQTHCEGGKKFILETDLDEEGQKKAARRVRRFQIMDFKKLVHYYESIIFNF